jgi:hypothetical protein
MSSPRGDVGVLVEVQVDMLCDTGSSGVGAPSSRGKVAAVAVAAAAVAAATGAALEPCGTSKSEAEDDAIEALQSSMLVCRTAGASAVRGAVQSRAVGRTATRWLLRFSMRRGLLPDTLPPHPELDVADEATATLAVFEARGDNANAAVVVVVVVALVVVALALVVAVVEASPSSANAVCRWILSRLAFRALLGDVAVLEFEED